MKLLKILLIYLIAILNLYPSAMALPQEHNYLQMRVKLYHPALDLNTTYQLIDRFPDVYYIGINAIRVYPDSFCHLRGYYHLSGVIDLCGNECYILAHELSHHIQNLMDERIDHSNQFWAYNKMMVNYC